MNQLIYSKFSTERASSFQIRTDILEEHGKKTVRKVPQTKAAGAHIENLKTCYELLRDDFADTPLEINFCEKKDDGVYFEFISGKSLEELLDELLEAERYEEMEQLMHHFFAVILKDESLRPFEETEEFREVFGTLELAGHFESRRLTDIDMIFSNLIVQDGRYHLLDYEWTFLFPVPVKFVIYRCLHYYVLGSQKRSILSLDHYFEEYRITKVEQEAFAVMEEHFQRYVTAGYVPMRAIMEEISPGSEDINRLVEAAYYLQVYRDYGEGFAESESEKLLFDRNCPIVERDVYLIPELKQVRIDPFPQACIFEVMEVSIAGEAVDYTTNSIPFGTNLFLSETEDPQMCISLNLEEACSLHLVLHVSRLDLFAADSLKKLRPDCCPEQPEQQLALEQPEKQEETSVMKRKKTLVYHIDRIEKTPEEGRIFGWAVSGMTDEVEISVETRDGAPIEARIETYAREDVNEIYGLEKECRTGFILHITLSQIHGGYVKVLFCADGKTASEVYKDRELWRSDYVNWIEAQNPGEETQRTQRGHQFAEMPLISIVIPAYNTPAVFLKELLASIQAQTYSNWELCLADASTKTQVKRIVGKYAKKDSRIRYIRLEENRGISENTNAAMEQAKGDWILFSDHDDVLCADALYEIVAKINEDDGIDAVYTDEDKMNADGDVFFDPTCKTEYNLTMLRNYNYITHIFAVKRQLLNEVGLLRAEYDGAQDYDFVLRCCEKANRIGHVAKILYHWRAHMNSTAGNSESKEYAYEAGRKALEAHYKRMGIPAEVTLAKMKGHYHTEFAVKGTPLVTILIPNKDQAETLDICIRSIEEKSSYSNYEILIIENNSEEQDTFDYYQKRTAQDERVHVITWEGEFNYSAIHNFAVKYAKGEYLILLNNDVEIMSGNWMESMLGYCQQEDVGIVGAKLLYPDDTVQHAGVIVGIGGIAGHIFYGAQGDSCGYCTWLATSHEMSCVTAACLMTKKSVYEKVDGMDELFRVAYNDVDYCLKVRETGYKVIYDADIWAYHYESKTRGYDTTPEKSERLKKEADRLTSKWKEFLQKGDPYYNRNLTLDAADCALKPIDN